MQLDLVEDQAGMEERGRWRCLGMIGEVISYVLPYYSTLHLVKFPHVPRFGLTPNSFASRGLEPLSFLPSRNW